LSQQEQTIIPANNNAANGNNSAGDAWLVMLSGDYKGRKYPLNQGTTTIGRSTKSDIVVADPKCSRNHIQIVNDGNNYWAVDAGSANGFYVNEHQVQRAQLKQNDIITIGLVRMAFQLANPNANGGFDFSAGNRATMMIDANAPTVMPMASTQAADGGTGAPQPPQLEETELERIELRGKAATVFGREPRVNDVVLDNPQISRRHLQIANADGVYTANDLGSTNGTYVNGQRITSVKLNDGDIITTGPYRFMFTNGVLYRSQDDESIRVDVLSVSRQITPTVKILHDVTFTILPHEFVAIVGGSGTGKTTLLDAISGVRPATEGAILYNKSDFYGQMDMYRASVGYVPQDDIVPAELTVYRALYYAGKLRLPTDTTDEELHERIMDVIDDLDLEGREDTPINLLSGGQRKRVSIGAELISKPSMFFLDEPTSGLDPGLEGKMMVLLRRLADQGRTVVLVTHATQNVHLCDQVLFLAKGGYLAFYGSPADALHYFAVDNFAGIYAKLDQEVSRVSPEEWAARFANSAFYSQNVLSRLQTIAGEAAKQGININLPPQSQTAPAVPPVTFRKPAATLSPLQQFILMCRRYLETITKDRRNLGILLFQAPLIALMMILVFKRSDWDRQTGDFGSARTLVFLLVIVAVWLGTSNSAREIVKEAAIFRRERRIGLKVVPYVLSKMVVQTLILLAQLLILVGIVWAGLGMGANPETIFYVYFTLILVGLGSVTMGLLISALNTNSDRAISFVPIVLIPQIIFGGAIVSFERMGPVGEFISHFMVAKWGYKAAGRILGLDGIPPTKLPFTGPPPENAGPIQALFGGSVVFDREKLQWYLIPTRNPEFTLDVYLCWGILALMVAVGLGLIFFFQVRKDKVYTR
jgi:ABC transport system ATP-binding/permease protein